MSTRSSTEKQVIRMQDMSEIEASTISCLNWVSPILAPKIDTRSIVPLRIFLSFLMTDNFVGFCIRKVTSNIAYRNHSTSCRAVSFGDTELSQGLTPSTPVLLLRSGQCINDESSTASLNCKWQLLLMSRVNNAR